MSGDVYVVRRLLPQSLKGKRSRHPHTHLLYLQNRTSPTSYFLNCLYCDRKAYFFETRNRPSKTTFQKYNHCPLLLLSRLVSRKPTAAADVLHAVHGSTWACNLGETLPCPKIFSDMPCAYDSAFTGSQKKADKSSTESPAARRPVLCTRKQQKYQSITAMTSLSLSLSCPLSSQPCRGITQLAQLEGGAGTAQARLGLLRCAVVEH